MLVLLLLTWAIGLTLGTALVMHPYLGSAITASNGSKETDFVTALYVGGSSLSIVGGSDYQPQTPGFKIFYLFNFLVGLSVISLTLTYLGQIYTALQSRNSTALQLDVRTGRTGDAAEFIAHLGPRGHFESGYTDLSSLGEAIARIKEAHLFYPVLFYFRFEKPIYSVSRVTNVALDTVSLIRSALDPDEYKWLIESGAVAETSLPSWGEEAKRPFEGRTWRSVLGSPPTSGNLIPTATWPRNAYSFKRRLSSRVCSEEICSDLLRAAKPVSRPVRLMRSKVESFARLPAQARSPRSELSSPGRVADVYSAFGLQRNLWNLRDKRRRRAFSATDPRHDNATNAAKCDVFAVSTRSFSGNEDLLAEGDGFEPPTFGL